MSLRYTLTKSGFTMRCKNSDLRLIKKFGFNWVKPAFVKLPMEHRIVDVRSLKAAKYSKCRLIFRNFSMPAGL